MISHLFVSKIVFSWTRLLLLCPVWSRRVTSRKNCVGKEEEHFVDYLVECGQENVLKGLTTEESCFLRRR